MLRHIPWPVENLAHAVTTACAIFAAARLPCARPLAGSRGVLSDTSQPRGTTDLQARVGQLNALAFQIHLAAHELSTKWRQ